MKTYTIQLKSLSLADAMSSALFARHRVESHNQDRDAMLDYYARLEEPDDGDRMATARADIEACWYALEDACDKTDN